jgi:hypothetical protein
MAGFNGSTWSAISVAEPHHVVPDVSGKVVSATASLVLS